jgi:hypothetical protein
MKKQNTNEKIFIASSKCIKYFMDQMDFGLREMATLFGVSVSTVFWWKEYGTKGSYYFDEKFRYILYALGLSQNDLKCFKK